MEGVEAWVGPAAAPSGDGDVQAAVMDRFRNSKAPEHQQLRAVVAAITQVLEEQGLPLAPVAYFGACMAPLEQQVEAGAVDGPDTAAFCALLVFLLPSLSQSVLLSRSQKLMEVLLKLLETTSKPCTIKPALLCLQHVLVAGDKSNWVSTMPAFGTLFKFIVDSRPKVRKRASFCLAEVMGSLFKSPAWEKASEAFATMFEQRMSAFGVSASKNKSKSKDTANPVEVLHMLGASRNVFPHLSSKALGKLLPTMLVLFQLKQPIVTRQVLEILLYLFMKCREQGRLDLPRSEAGNVLVAVSSLISTANKNVDEVTSAVRVLQYGLLNLSSVDPAVCSDVLPAPFHAITELFACEQEEVAFTAADCLRNLIQECITDAMIAEGVRVGEDVQTSVKRVCSSAESTLSYQYAGHWDKALSMIASLFGRLGEASYLLMAGTVKGLAQLQNLSDDDMPFRKQLHEALGAAVEAMGPEHFLNTLPFQLDAADLTKARIWLFPILKQHIVGAKLWYFHESILPLASNLSDRAKEFHAEGKVATARNAEACTQSLWALLPSFCNYPVDTESSFPQIAKPLGDAMKREPELRGIISSGLQILIRQNRICRGDLPEREDDMSAKPKPRSYYSSEVASGNLAAIAGFADHFLPLLFNLFCASSPTKRGDLQGAINAFASISSRATVQKFFKTVMQKLLEATKAPDGKDQRLMFMDLGLCLIGGLNDAGLNALFAVAKPALQDKDSGVQKKGYKILASLCKQHPAFLNAKAAEVLELVIAATSSCQSAAKQYRILCLQALALHLVKTGETESCMLLLKEAILALKEINNKTRDAAYDFLIGIAHSLRDEHEDNSQLVQFFVMVMGCSVVTRTAGEPHVISAAISGISRLVYEFPGELESEVEKYLPSAYYLLSNYKSREVIKSLLGLMKVIVARLPTERLSLQLGDMVKAMMTWSDESKNRFKAKVRVILEKLIRRCGFDAVSAVMPPEHAKHLTNIRKRKEQAEKKKQRSIVDGGDEATVYSKATTSRRSKWNHSDFFSDVNDSDEEEDEINDDGDTQIRSRSKSTVRSKKLPKSKKRLPEDVTEAEMSEPLNLLDVHMTRAALSAPRRKAAEADDDDDGVRFDTDGRLVVEENSQKKRRREVIGDGDGDEDDQDEVKSRTSKKFKSSKAGNKRQKKSATSWAYKGEEYGSKKSGGDVKKERKLEPYAYWPLDPKLLNRRRDKAAAARKGMQSVFNMAKKAEGLTVNKALTTAGSSHSISKKRKSNVKAKAKPRREPSADQNFRPGRSY